MKKLLKTRFGKILFAPPHFILMFILLVMSGRVSAQQSNFSACGQKNSPSFILASNIPKNCSEDFSDFIERHTLDLVSNGTRNVKIRTNVIFAQNEEGEGNFSVNNPEHMTFWKIVFEKINARLASVYKEDCYCSTTPEHYENTHIEFVPNFIEVRDNFAWDHNNDPEKDIFDSYDKSYLNYINILASQTPGYQKGFNAILTNDKDVYNEYVYNNPQNLEVWKLPGYKSVYDGASYSSNPTSDLAHDPLWHAPDYYIGHISGVDHYGGQAWANTDRANWVAGAFLHEYGHYFNLGHEFGCSHNVMEYANLRNSLSGCQVREMYTTLMTKNLRSSIICEDALDFALNVVENETWNVNMRVLGDVIIKNGGTLTITCEVHMSPKGKIIVERGGKLIIDGGLITTDCEERWNGIVVEGDVFNRQLNSGIVELKNYAIIENARTAITTFPYYLPWNNGLLEDYYGGIVQAENSTIRKCGRGVAFMKYGQAVPDKSWFRNVTFEKLDQGVTLWANNGVTFKKCKFNTISKHGIFPYDSKIIANDGCKFEKMPIGVDVLTTYPITYSSQIGALKTAANQFYCKDAGVNIQSEGNIEPLRIFNNVFTEGKKGVKQNGHGLFEIAKNRFDQQLTSIELYEGGSYFNRIFQNEITYSYLGSHAVKKNTGLNYNDNCFDFDKLTDIFVSDGSINPKQGDASLAAGNYFTKKGIPEIDNDAGTVTVNYYVRNGLPVTSYQRPEISTNIILQKATTVGIKKCGLEPPGNTEDVNSCDINEDMSLDLLKNKRNELLKTIESSGAQTSDQQLHISEYRTCVAEIENLIGRKMLAPQSTEVGTGKENAIAFFSSQGMDFLNKTTAYGIMVASSEYDRASAYLNSLETQNQEQLDFIKVQHINLDYLSNQQEYQVTSETKDYLYKVGKTDGSLNGYARSLYEVLTGERIEVEIPEVIIKRTLPLSNDNLKTSDFVVYPNPAQSDMCTLSINKVDGAQRYDVFLSDATGTVSRTWKFEANGDHSLNLDHIPSGI